MLTQAATAKAVTTGRQPERTRVENKKGRLGETAPLTVGDGSDDPKQPEYEQHQCDHTQYMRVRTELHE
jgi:hypothetical protein